MKRQFATILILVFLLPIVFSMPVYAATDVSFKCFGNDSLNTLMLTLTRSDGSSYTVSDNGVIPSKITPGETVTLKLNLNNDIFKVGGLYSVANNKPTEISPSSGNTYSWTVPSSTSQLCAVLTKNGTYPIEYDSLNGEVKLSVVGGSVYSEGLAFAHAYTGNSFTFTSASGQTMEGKFINSLTNEVIASGKTCYVPGVPMTFIPSFTATANFPDKNGSVTHGLTNGHLISGEKITVKSTVDSNYMSLYSGSTLLDVYPVSATANTYEAVVPYGHSELSFIFSDNEIMDISSRDDFATFVSRVNNGETTLNADLTVNLTLNTTEQINSYNGIFNGNNHTISGLNDALINENNGAVKNLTLNSTIDSSNEAAAFAITNNGAITSCFNAGTVSGSKVGAISVTNSGAIRFCGSFDTPNNSNFGGIAYTNNGIVDSCYSKANNVVIEGNDALYSYYLGEINENTSGTNCTERQLYKGHVANRLNTREERFGQALSKNIAPVAVTSSNKIYSIKVISRNLTKEIYTNKSADNFYLFLAKYNDSGKLTSIIDAIQNTEYSTIASTSIEKGVKFNQTVTVNTSLDDTIGRKVFLINKSTLGPLEDVFTIYRPASEEYTYIVLTPDHFNAHLGCWNIVNVSSNIGGGFNTKLLQCKNTGVVTDPAIKNIVIPKDGFYTFHAYSYGYHENDTSPGLRFYDVQVGDFPKVTMGNSPQLGWQWETVTNVPLLAGEHECKIIDSSGHYARMGMLVITNDPNFTIDKTQAGFDALLEKSYVDQTYEPTDTSDYNRPDTEYAAKINNSYIGATHPPIMVNDTLMVPYDEFLEELGYYVTYDEASLKITATNNGRIINLFKGKNIISIEDKYTIMPNTVTEKNGTFYVPAKYITEQLGGVFKWVEQDKLAIIYVTPSDASFLFRPDSFSDLGTWTYKIGMEDAFDELGLLGLAQSYPTGNEKPAVAYFDSSQEGDFYFWVHSRDYATDSGSRYFGASVNGVSTNKNYGQHGIDGWAWEVAPAKVHLIKGKNKLELLDTSAHYARCDAIFITKSPDTPPQTLNSLKKLATPVQSYAYKNYQGFPLYATELKTPTESAVIENNSVRVVFYKVPTSNGTVIQNEIYAKDSDGNWVCTNTRDEELGYLVVKSHYAVTKSSEEVFVYYSEFTDNSGAKHVYNGVNPYFAGNALWYVPTSIEVLGNNSVRLTATGNDLTLKATWTLDEHEKTPLVSLDITAKNGGYYTVGSWEGGKLGYDEFEQAIAPFRVKEKQVHEVPNTITQKYLFTPMGAYTLYENNKYSKYPVTKGVVVDSDWLPIEWIHDEDNRFGMNMVVSGGGYKSTLFYPALGTEESNFSANETINLKYRVISSVSDWFENYKYVIQDIYEVDDYRKNTQTTLNQAIFNTRELVKDDVYGGWDSNSMGHYNIEAIETIAQANPMQAVQDYLLTGDEEMLEKRAIPTIASFLTRGGLQFNPTDYAWGSTTDYKEIYKEPDSIGSSIGGYNANVTNGLYEMTHGMMPTLYELGLKKGNNAPTNLYGSIPVFVNYLSMYHQTGQQSYLDKAIASADNYLETTVYPLEEKHIKWEGFVYISYFPNLASLMDMYEATGYKRYLDAAEYTAQQILTSLWVPGVDNDKKQTQIMVNDNKEVYGRHYPGEFYRGMFWAGDKQFRVGYGQFDPNNLTSDQINLVANVKIENKAGYVDSWIPSRVGLGLEQPSTFGNSSNIIMQCWAGDMMRLAQYTGEKAFENAARNAIIGRFSNYSGYYQADHYTFQQYADYPLEGPDYTGIYWHHIPPFLAMLEDFLINQSFNWSDEKIKFPALRQQGYAYFNSNQYGHAPGKFYDDEDMWLWIDDGMVDTGNVQIDWVAARKNGVFDLALMNESDTSVTTTVKLLNKIPGASTYTGTAYLFHSDGSKTPVTVTNGSFTATVPAKTLHAFHFDLPKVTAPDYAKAASTLQGDYEIGSTVSEHTNGKGYTLQLSPDKYFAYVYITDKPATTKKLSMTYYDIETNSYITVSDNDYPYEFIIKVNNPNTKFVYNLTATMVNNTEKYYGNGSLTTLEYYKKYGNDPNVSKTEQTAEYTGNHGSFEPVKINYTRYGTSGNTFRLVVPNENLGEGFKDSSIIGLPVKGTFTPTNGKSINIESVITGFEAKTNECIISIGDTPEIRTAKYNTSSTGTFDLYIHELVAKTTQTVPYTGNHGFFDPIELNYTRSGQTDNQFRLVVPQANLPEGFNNESIVGLPVKGIFHPTSNSSVKFESVITGFETRTDGTFLITVADTPQYPSADYSVGGANEFLEIKIYEMVPCASGNVTYEGLHGSFTPFNLSYSRFGYTSDYFRIITTPSALPAGFRDSSIVGLPVKATFTDTSGKKMYLKTFITNFESRTDGTVMVGIKEGAEILTSKYQSSSNGTFNLVVCPYES